LPKIFPPDSAPKDFAVFCKIFEIVFNLCINLNYFELQKMNILLMRR
jgi:hypothetical protein